MNRERFYHQERSQNMTQWRHTIGLNDEEGIYQNWYPNNKNLVVRDLHCPAVFSICFDNEDEFILPKSDQNMLYTLTVPLGMRVKAVLKYCEGEPYKVELIELTPEELTKLEADKEQFRRNIKT